MRWAKWLGLAGLVGAIGVAGVQIYRVRHRRQFADLPPDELRDRLHVRLAAARGRWSSTA